MEICMFALHIKERLLSTSLVNKKKSSIHTILNAAGVGIPWIYIITQPTKRSAIGSWIIRVSVLLCNSGVLQSFPQSGVNCDHVIVCEAWLTACNNTTLSLPPPSPSPPDASFVFHAPFTVRQGSENSSREPEEKLLDADHAKMLNEPDGRMDSYRALHPTRKMCKGFEINQF